MLEVTFIILDIYLDAFFLVKHLGPTKLSLIYHQILLHHHETITSFIFNISYYSMFLS